jgi:hypothetical protein
MHLAETSVLWMYLFTTYSDEDSLTFSDLKKTEVLKVS